MAEVGAEIVKETNTWMAQFQQALGRRIRHLEWRSTMTFDSGADFIAEQARTANGRIQWPSFCGGS
jgi:hypothetical protein